VKRAEKEKRSILKARKTSCCGGGHNRNRDKTSLGRHYGERLAKTKEKSPKRRRTHGNPNTPHLKKTRTTAVPGRGEVFVSRNIKPTQGG